MDLGSSPRALSLTLSLGLGSLGGCSPAIDEADTVALGSSGETTDEDETGSDSDDVSPEVAVCAGLVDDAFGEICHDDYCESVDSCALGLSCSIAGALESPDAEGFVACMTDAASPEASQNELVDVCEAELPTNPACEAACARVQECHPDEYASKYTANADRSCLAECSVQETSATLDCMASESCERISIPRTGSLGGHSCGCEQGDWSCKHPSLDDICE